VLQSALSASVSATGLCGTAVQGNCTGSADKVYIEFTTLDTQGNPTASSKFLAPSADGSSWTGTVSSADNFIFGEGSQFMTFVGLRQTDGKANAVVTNGATKLCTPADSNCSQSSLPAFVGQPNVPATVSITPSGALNADVSVSAALKNVTSADSVSVGFLTLSGFVSVLLQPNTATCTTSSCTFSGTVSKAAGYAFASGNRPFYFTAAQVKSSDPSSVDQGSTVATTSSNVAFS
jgi:hypothetical protein